MPLQAPNLDTRSFDQLVKEAKERIPRYTQEWTNFNDADPGMTIVKLQAWLTETLLHEINRVPDLHYVKFLNLLNIQASPARAATTDLQFSLQKLDNVDTDPLSFFIPKSAQIEADDPDLSVPVTFETDRTLRAINASIAAIITPAEASDSTREKALISQYDDKLKTAKLDASFYPFSESPAVGDECIIGILLRPHRKKEQDYSQQIFPEGELELAVSASEVYDNDQNNELISGPTSTQCKLGFEQDALTKSLEWQVYVGSDHASGFTVNGTDASGWQTLFPPVDGSQALSKTGYLNLPIPANISQVSLQAMSRSFWLGLGLKKLPTSGHEFLGDLLDTDLNYTADNIADLDLVAMLSGVIDSGALLPEILQEASQNLVELHGLLEPFVGLIRISQETQDAMLEGDFGYSTPTAPNEAMAWLKVKVVNADYSASLLNGFYLNRVPATAAVTRLEEVLGVSDARPSQTFQVAKTPVDVELNAENKLAPDFDLVVVQAGEVQQWQRIDDFGAVDITSFSQVYRLDPISGQVWFGDGVKGQIPVANSQVKVTRYRYGGGSQGNVAIDTLTKLKTSLTNVKGVTNPRSVSDGKDAETLEQAKQRAPQTFASSTRAVTADDFAFFTRQTPNVNIHSAYALAQTALDDAHNFVTQEGAVTMVVLPNNTKQAKPEPSESQLKAVCAHLNNKRLITTELYVTGPRYVDISELSVQLKVKQSADLQQVSTYASERLLSFFNPLIGGNEGKGWPFGEDIYFSEIYSMLQQIEGVKRVFSLALKLAGTSTVACTDYIAVDAGHLLSLSRDVMNIQVSYERT
jgi:hypothetical protein